MNKRVFRYPFITRLGMSLGLGGASLFLIGFLYFLVITMKNLINGIPNRPDIVGLLLSLFFGFLMFLYIVNAYPDIEVAEDGLLLNASGIRFHVLWGDIKRVRRGYGKVFKTYAIETNGLTPFHRMYGIMYLQTFTRCFIIWSIMPDYENLLSEIRKHENEKCNR